jgi:hypothetical protein
LDGLSIGLSARLSLRPRLRLRRNQPCSAIGSFLMNPALHPAPDSRTISRYSFVQLSHQSIDKTTSARPHHGIFIIRRLHQPCLCPPAPWHLIIRRLHQPYRQGLALHSPSTRLHTRALFTGISCPLPLLGRNAARSTPFGQCPQRRPCPHKRRVHAVRPAVVQDPGRFMGRLPRRDRVVVTDGEAHDAVGALNGVEIKASPCGAATLAALKKVCDVEKANLGLTEESVVVLLNTESARQY